MKRIESFESFGASLLLLKYLVWGLEGGERVDSFECFGPASLDQASSLLSSR